MTTKPTIQLDADMITMVDAIGAAKGLKRRTDVVRLLIKKAFDEVENRGAVKA